MISFIIPAYNEAENLPELLSSLRSWASSRHEDCRLIAVDDGSRDATAEILSAFRDLPVVLVRHEVNRGVHEVFRSGFHAWSEMSAEVHDLVVTVEADNTSSLGILDTMVDRARAGDDLVLASCYALGGEVVGTNLYRHFLSFCANLILRCIPGMPRVSTFSSFYRIYRAPCLEAALRAYGPRFIEEQGFVCVVEMLLKFGMIGAHISEVPFRLDGQRRKGASKMRVGRTVRGYLHLFLRAVTGRVATPLNQKRIEERLFSNEAHGGH
jgi:dolichol-phosphate mannosyltransferase